jgi:hypothetical protein
MDIARVARAAFLRLPLRTVGKGRTAFLSRSIFAARSLLFRRWHRSRWRRPSKHRTDALVTFNVRDFGTVPSQFGIEVFLPREAIRRIKA